MRISKNLPPFVTNTERSKPVMRMERIASKATITMTSGARLRFSSTPVPFGSV